MYKKGDYVKIKIETIRSQYFFNQKYEISPYQIYKIIDLIDENKVKIQDIETGFTRIVYNYRLYGDPKINLLKARKIKLNNLFMKNWEKYKIDLEYKNGWVYNWFSNMIEVNIEIDGVLYRSVENYYQSQKVLNEDDKKIIMLLRPHRCKRQVKFYDIRNDWNSIKDEVMKKALEAKFSIPEWKEKLLNTKNEKIIEWNNWNDKYWGVSIFDNLGHNKLGLMLMEIRTNLRTKSLF